MHSSDPSSTSDDRSQELPPVIGDRYRIGRELGHGGMARVYLAQDLKHGRDVAVKVIRAELAASLGRERFLREIDIAARLRHPNIVPLYDSGDVQGTLYFVMPYEDGPSLRTRLAATGALPIADVIAVLRDVARALQYAHTQGVVHRDIKPDNIMMSGGAAVVADFGIAKAVSAARDGTTSALTQTGTGIGTPAYMAPEQAVADPTSDHRADLYSYGCVAFELLAGRPPFVGAEAYQLIAAHVSTTAPAVTTLRADTPRALADLIAGCLEKNPDARPQYASVLVDVLEGTNAISLPSVSHPEHRRRRVSAVVGLAIACALGVAWVLRGVFASAEPISVGVLPIVNISADSTIAIFADGLGDEIFTALSRVPGVEMRSRSGARNYVGKVGVDAKAVGRALNVQYLVTGVMRPVGGRWVVSAEMTRTADGSELWTGNFDRAPAQQVGVASEIADAAAAALRAKFPRALGVAPERAANQQTTSGEAYRLFVLGQELLRRRGQNVSQGADAFRQAIRIDPKYAGAHAGLAMSLVLFPYFVGTPASDVYAEVTTIAERALELDSTLAQPHTALGMAYAHDYQWARADSQFRRAIQRDPTDVEAHVQYGRYLLTQRLHARALEQFQLARRSDPASALVLSWTSYTFYILGQADSARVISAQALQSGATNFTTLVFGAEVLLGTGARDSALALARRVKISNATIEYVLAAAGDTAAASTHVRELERQTPPPALAHTSRAFMLLGVGDTSGALTALEAATDAHEIWPAFQPVTDPIFKDIRYSARLRALLLRTGLPTGTNADPR
jgi:serine/threonine-protein kinase